MKSIEVVIGGRKYPVKVTEDEEQALLAAIEEIEQKLRDFQQMYRGKDKQDYLSMALLTYALETIKGKRNDEASEQITARIDDLFAALESASL